MINIFRKIRQNLFMENKTGKPSRSAGRYIKYAVGEIVLVIFGILIALQINSLNEDRNNANKINSILKEIQVDLHTDIQRAKEIIIHNKKQDSLILRVTNGFFTHEEYKKDKSNLFLISDIEHMII